MSFSIMPPNGNSSNILGNSNGSLGGERNPYKPNTIPGSHHRTNSERQQAGNEQTPQNVPTLNGHVSHSLMDGAQLPSALSNGHTPIMSNGHSPACGPSYPRRSLAIMLREEERLKTYRRWPVTFMDPKKLAEAGFYYTNRDDLVRCAFCGIELGRWEEGDDVLADHQRWSPMCPFLRKLPVGNVPINGPPQEEDPAVSYDTCGLYGIQVRPFSAPERTKVNSTLGELSLENLGVNRSHGPAFPEFSTYDARLTSFENWPVSLKQRPDKLSDAGFYYTGKGDQTVCFHCGGGLKDWEEDDDPWTEHALWFSRCSYVLLVMGRDFVAEVCCKKDALLTAKKVMRRQAKQKCHLPRTTINLRIQQEFQELRKAQQAQQAQQTQTQAVTSTETNRVASRAPSTSESPASEAEAEGSRKATSDALLCKICFTDEMGVVFLPCGHVVACIKCASAMSTCALCRKPVTATVRAFLS